MDILIRRERSRGRRVIQNDATLRSGHVLQDRVWQPRRRQGRSEKTDRDRVGADGGFRLDPLFVPSRKNQEASLGARMLDCDPHERLDELAEDDLTRYGLRGPDYRSHLQLFDGCADGCGRRDRFFTEVRMDLFELSYLALGPPAKIAIPGVPQIEMRNLLEAARRI